MTGEPQKNSPLDNITVATPCDAKWSEMSGDDRARLCKHCNRHVYNLSAMPRAEAETLAREKEGKICVRFFRRADGTVITDNCPVGLRAARDRLRWIAAGIASSAITLWVFGSNPRAVGFMSWFVEAPQPAPAQPPPPPPTPPDEKQILGLIVRDDREKARLQRAYERMQKEREEKEAKVRKEDTSDF